jgi:TrpR-related protein YerC/YecD
MNKKIKTDAVDSLFDAVLCLQSREECYSFFEDLCTVNELLSLSQRFEVAAMLKDGKTYLEIAEKTGHHQPRKPFTELRQRRLRAGLWTYGEKGNGTEFLT